MQPVPLIQHLRRSGFRRPSGPAAPRRIPSEGARKKAAKPPKRHPRGGASRPAGPLPRPGQGRNACGQRPAQRVASPSAGFAGAGSGRRPGEGAAGKRVPVEEKQRPADCSVRRRCIGIQKAGGRAHSGAGPSCTGAAPPMRAARLASAAATASARSCSRATRSFWSISLASSGLSFRKLRAFSRP